MGSFQEDGSNAVAMAATNNDTLPTRCLLSRVVTRPTDLRHRQADVRDAVEDLPSEEQERRHVQRADAAVWSRERPLVELERRESKLPRKERARRTWTPTFHQLQRKR